MAQRGQPADFGGGSRVVEGRWFKCAIPGEATSETRGMHGGANQRMPWECQGTSLCAWTEARPALGNNGRPGNQSLILLLKGPVDLLQRIGTREYLVEGVFILGSAQEVEGLLQGIGPI